MSDQAFQISQVPSHLRLAMYRHHKASGQAVVVLRGRYVYLGEYNTPESHEKYQATIAEYIAARGVTPQERVGMTVSELILHYWRYAQDCYSRETLNGSIKPALKRLRRLLGGTAVAEFGPLKLKAYRQALIDETGESSARLCRTYINRLVRQVRSLFKWGVGEELVQPSVYHGLLAVEGIRYGRCKAPEPEPVTPVADLYVRAVVMARSDAISLVERECAGDTQLKTRVLDLLGDAAPLSAEHDQGCDRDDQTASGSDDLAAGTRIGKYTIIRKIAAGGMGVVYLVEQERPRREVALKLLRAERLKRAAFRRFELEAEILGRLHHPGIAQVYEAGMIELDDDFGPQPFIAMEYVRGQKLDAYLRNEPRSFAAKLRLLEQICEAVHHVHERGPVHRDLKPPNILVTEGGVRLGIVAMVKAARASPMTSGLALRPQ